MATKLKIKTIPYVLAHKQNLLGLLDGKPFKQKIQDWQFTGNPCSERFGLGVLADRWDAIISYNGIVWDIRSKLIASCPILWNRKYG